MITRYSDYKFYIKMDVQANGINSMLDYIVKHVRH